MSFTRLMLAALISAGASAAPGATSPTSTTSAYEAPRPTSVPGFSFSFATQIPTAGQDGKLGGGAGFTDGAANGMAAGTLLGLGPTGPYSANGAIQGGYQSLAGSAQGNAGLTTAYGEAGFVNGQESGFLQGSLATTALVGCGGIADGAQGFTQCITLPPAVPTP